MRAFDYASATTVADALALLGGPHGSRSQALAGGTDLLPQMKCDLAAPERVVDIKRASGLSRDIAEADDGVIIGALATLRDIETSALIRERHPALAEAAALAATPQLRNVATLGGNLLQRPRCWYFRDPRFHCWLKGGDTCPAREGEHRQHAVFDHPHCIAVHPSDLAPVLVALDAEVRLQGQDRQRALPLAAFLCAPTDERRTETAIERGELVLAVRLPHWPQGTRSTYLKAMDRKTWSFALAGVAVTLRSAGQTAVDARIVLGGVASVAWRAHDAEAALTGARLEHRVLDQVAELALAQARPLPSNAYKVPLAKALVRRALERVAP